MRTENRAVIAAKEVIGKVNAIKLSIIVSLTIIYCKMVIINSYALSPGSTLGDRLKETLNAAYGQIVGIIAVVYGFALVIGAIRIYISSGREVEGIWAYIKRCTVAFIIIILASTIVAFVSSMVGDGAKTLA